MILIAGDSWGAGEWCSKPLNVTHNGLSRYICESGHTTVNLSRPSGSNLESSTRIVDFLLCNHDLILSREKLTSILIFQTEWDRDYLLNQKERVERFDYPYIKDRYISMFYNRLSDISIRYNTPVYIIGACSDAIWLDKFESEYPGVSVICQSLVNLLLNNDHRTSTPVYSFFTKSSESLLEELKRN